MNKTLLFAIPIVLVGVAAGIGLLFFTRGSEIGVTPQDQIALTPSPVPQVTPSPLTQITPSPVPQNGIIEGTLSYPSEGIPKTMQICAETLAMQQVACTNEHVKMDSQSGSGVGYKLSVPAGQYYVYAFLPDNPSYKAYYSEFVTCGLSVDCKSHTPIVVSVEAGKTTSNIRPHDWYAGN